MTSTISSLLQDNYILTQSKYDSKASGCLASSLENYSAFKNESCSHLGWRLRCDFIHELRVADAAIFVLVIAFEQLGDLPLAGIDSMLRQNPIQLLPCQISIIVFVYGLEGIVDVEAWSTAEPLS